MVETKIDFLYLNEEDMIKAGVTGMEKCVDCMEEMFKILGRGDYKMAGQNGDSHGAMVTFPADPPFPNMPQDGPDRRFMAMPAYLGGKFDIAGMKWYGSNAENRHKGLPRSILMVMLNDKDTGAPLALMSANLLSAYRTGAVPGVGAKYLAPKNSKVLGVIGPGVMSKTSLEAFVYACPTLEAIKIKGRGQASIDSFIEFARRYPQFREISVVDTMEEACKDADIVTIGTSSTMGMENYPFLEEKWLKPGMLLSAPAYVRLDDDFLARRARKVLENYGLYECWANDYAYPSFSAVGIIGVRYFDLLRDKLIRREDIISLSDVISGAAPAREFEGQIVVNSVGGMPVEDLAWGKTIWQNALRLGLGVSLNLWDSPAMV
ncbi:MAG: ornithine cyclodeaminase [Gracilibacteraceae bacterium]|jgi:ornithine cyclodeaminase|nr:ornithine cyclodeaminase [Gracilibacteraceae bacterium]